MNLVNDENAFKEQFEHELKKKKNPVVSKKHQFDSRHTVITVGQEGHRYPYSTEDFIFSLDDLNPDTLRAQGLIKKDKIKPSLVTDVETCGVCRKPRADFKSRKVAQCEFCASFGCIDCIYKVFPFP